MREVVKRLQEMLSIGRGSQQICGLVFLALDRFGNRDLDLPAVEHRPERFQETVVELNKLSPFPKWLYHRLPDRFCLVPKRPCFRLGSSLASDPRLRKRGWDEFWWKDEVFGFHLRNVGRKEKLEHIGEDQPYLEYLFREKLGLDVHV